MKICLNIRYNDLTYLPLVALTYFDFLKIEFKRYNSCYCRNNKKIDLSSIKLKLGKAFNNKTLKEKAKKNGNILDKYYNYNI